jgi:hypothetical protein
MYSSTEQTDSRTTLVSIGVTSLPWDTKLIKRAGRKAMTGCEKGLELSVSSYYQNQEHSGTIDTVLCCDDYFKNDLNINININVHENNKKEEKEEVDIIDVAVDIDGVITSQEETVPVTYSKYVPYSLISFCSIVYVEEVRTTVESESEIRLESRNNHMNNDNSFLVDISSYMDARVFLSHTMKAISYVGRLSTTLYLAWGLPLVSPILHLVLTLSTLTWSGLDELHHACKPIVYRIILYIFIMIYRTSVLYILMHYVQHSFNVYFNVKSYYDFSDHFVLYGAHYIYPCICECIFLRSMRHSVAYNMEGNDKNATMTATMTATMIPSLIHYCMNFLFLWNIMIIITIIFSCFNTLMLYHTILENIGAFTALIVMLYVPLAQYSYCRVAHIL